MNVDNGKFKYGRDYYYHNFTIDLIHNPYTLNIFTDVSTKDYRDPKGRRITHSCYGAVAVNTDVIIDEEYGLCNDCTSDSGELRGIRKGISLAFKHRQNFKNINIFSDSAYSVEALNDWFYNSWRYDPNKQCIVTGQNKAIKNQSLIIECIQLLEMLRQTNTVNIYHISGHIDNEPKSIKEATTKFRHVNRITGDLDYTVIRYAVMYNNYIDNHTRSVVRTTDFINNTYADPVTFHPFNLLPGQIR